MIDSDQILNIKDKADFDKKALKIFEYQLSNNPVYRSYSDALNITKKKVECVSGIPFLPIGFFKTQKIIVNGKEPDRVFNSSGTSNKSLSRHYVADIEIYENSFYKGFEQRYGSLENFCVIALLPSYLEREGSSLIHMVKGMINKTNHPDSGFFLNNTQGLLEKLVQLDKKGQQVLLLGVSFALLDLSKQNWFNTFKGFGNLIIMETGGMKGRKREMVREELHGILTDRFKAACIHSEYGMTELLSQAYSKGKGKFKCPPWMQVSIRDINDPFSNAGHGQAGGINIIDLANIYSCPFIATDDLGRTFEDGTFEVLGRIDQSDVRGCSQMV